MSEGRLTKEDTYLLASHPLAVTAVEAIRNGNIVELKRLLDENPDLAAVRLVDDTNLDRCTTSSTLLLVATDWPGHFPKGAETVAILVAAGADVNARFAGPHTETPLHWAASSDDVAVLDALLDHGAEIDADGGIGKIGNGTPIADAIIFGQWKAALRLVERGAKTTLWQAAALGLMDRVEGYFTANAKPSFEEITSAFWCACHGGQHLAAEYLLSNDADINWVGYDQSTPMDAARQSGATALIEWLDSIGAKSVHDLK
ncbi:MAG: ankyrin repeat domain-containing protein [Planctomycetes bacterium]|nr:ankyrin repeat domain-containing protein [Planctomycetota bacterium]